MLGEVDVDRDELLDVAARYDIVDDVEALLEYLDTEGEDTNGETPNMG